MPDNERMSSPRTASRASERPDLGLRERKKIKTREAIRTATYDLVEEQGYEATTVEQIAERAEVSPSTVFRYFPTKEDIVLTDEYDPILVEELRARPVDEPWLDSVRVVMRRALEMTAADNANISRQRAHLVATVPAVHSRAMETMSLTGRMLTASVAERTGLEAGSLEVRVYTMSLMAALMEVSLYWAENGHEGDLGGFMERAVDVFEHGLPACDARNG
jgi:AcrR family transcriptional regulator